jgi:glycogen debranching enzyme
MRIILLLPDRSAAEEQAVHAWLHQQSGPRAGVHPLQGFSGAECDILWIHSGALVVPSSATLAMLGAQRPRAGFLFSGGAAFLPHQLGWDPAPHVASGAWRASAAPADGRCPADFELRGHAGFRAHPLLGSLHGGVYTWQPVDGERFVSVRYRLPYWPQRARVIAVERNRAELAPEFATIWEYDDGSGPRALCVGAYFAFTAQSTRFQRQHEQLARAALRHLELKPKKPGSAWRVPGTATRQDPGLPRLHTGADRPGALTPADSPLTLEEGGADDPFTLAGRRALATGTEGGGTHELWVHPLRAFYDLEILAVEPVGADLSPLGIERTFESAGVTVDEAAVVPHELGALVIEWSATAPVTLDLRWRCDLRMAWPYPPGALGDLRWHHEGSTLQVRTEDDQDIVCFHCSGGSVEWQVRDASDRTAALEVRARLAISGEQPLRLVVAASSPGSDDINTTLTALRDPLSLANAHLAASRRLQLERFAASTPEPDLGAAIEWAKHRLDSCILLSPGVGRSLASGYGPSGGPADGRPGRAWYLGPDAVWTALGALAVGDIAPVRDALRFFGEKQDISGAIFHECTTGGLLRYDALEATPLYLLLIARYHAWTGDTALVTGEWEHVRSALRFCTSSEAYGDGLSEPASPLEDGSETTSESASPALRVTCYQAALWAAALQELERTAQDLGHRPLAGELHARAKQAREFLDDHFSGAAMNPCAPGMEAENGAGPADASPAIFNAIPLLLGVADPERAAARLDGIAANSPSAHGVRLSPSRGVLFEAGSPEARAVSPPRGALVSPLHTAWVSWAEYAAAREPQAWQHLLANVKLLHTGAKGAWPELLEENGGASANGCPDYAPAAAMLAATVVGGMLGAEPDAFHNRLRLRPQLPDSWERCEFRNLRVGDAAVTLRFERDLDRFRYRVVQEQGAAPLTLLLEPIVAARALRIARVNGQPATLSPQSFAGRLIVPVQLVLDAERVLEIELEGVLS